MWSQSKRHNFKNDLWSERYKEKSTGSKAIYIDIEEEENEEEDTRNYSKWSELPDLLLEKIFAYLGIREKYYASLVCRNWYRAFHLPYVWSRFVLEDNTLTRSRFNYYSGWQYVLDHLRCQMCMSSVGKNFKYLTIEPMLNFYNLYEFMNILSWYTEQQKTLKGFVCLVLEGKLLAALKRLMGNLKKLQWLGLIDLMLDPKEAQYLLDEVCETCCLTLRSLYIVNTTRVQYQMLHVGVFLNLHELVISPQNLGDDLIELIGFTKLKHLHILQNRYTPYDVIIKPVSPMAWKKCRQNNAGLSVHLQLESLKEKPLIWQENAPVRTVLYDSPHIRLRADALLTTIEFYKEDLRIYGHKNIPRFHRSKSFSERIDENLIMLVQRCTYLSTLNVVIRVNKLLVKIPDFNGSPSTPQKPTPCRNLNSQDFDGNFRVLQDGLRRTLSGKNPILAHITTSPKVLSI
ncbi:hypothetical protein NQ318_015657 [Aromia moschata]|uniref:F-box domain-containing protein n=1 Tax=Aromia moschata TaxID=1265417 RepID=A0AAV8XQ45_9CUCU|nr:hypothetical protein NQ318_015657 [Aromia moschata]